MISDRTVIIINTKPDLFQNVCHTVNVFMASGCVRHIIVCTKTPEPSFNMMHEVTTCSNAVIPAGCDSDTKIRNWINSSLYAYGFTHVLTDDVELLKDPSQFIDALETMMDVFDYNVWFSTVTDGCNYVYSKYNPRMTVNMNKPEADELKLSKSISFTSHANTQWVAYDMRNLKDSDLLRFEEKFTIPMFYIIEFLARRKATKKSTDLYYMNQYMTVEEEYGTFKNLAHDHSQPLPDILKAEDDIFKEMNINYAADSDIDVILELMWDKMRLKLKHKI